MGRTDPTGKWVSSGAITSDTAVLANSGTFKKVVVIGDGTNACSVVVHDDPDSADGTVIAQARCLSTAAPAQAECGVEGPDGVHCSNGIYVDITGTGATAIVYYRDNPK